MKIYSEVFTSPFQKKTREEAQRVLDEIRANHPASRGWRELNAYVEKLPNGMFRAVREHAKVM